MQPTKALSCWQCGTVVSAEGGRCPACGVDQKQVPIVTSIPAVAPRGPSLSPALQQARAAAKARSASRFVPWVALAVGLLGAAALAAAFAPKKAAPVTAPASVAPASSVVEREKPLDPNDIGVKDLAAVDPSELLGKAKARALAWNREAQLVALFAEPVTGSQVNVADGGTVEYSFATPAGGGFAPGARTTGKLLRIRLTAAGTEIKEAVALTSRVALEPNCPLDEAIQKARAAGLSGGASFAVRYEVSAKHDRAVWRVAAAADPAHPRILDGSTCAILVR